MVHPRNYRWLTVTDASDVHGAGPTIHLAARQQGPTRLHAAVLVGIALACIAFFAGADIERTDEPEVCTSTVYEGCPGRWEAEWATTTE